SIAPRSKQNQSAKLRSSVASMSRISPTIALFPLLSRLPSQSAGKGARKVAAFPSPLLSFPPSLIRGERKGRKRRCKNYLSRSPSFLSQPQLYDDTRT